MHVDRPGESDPIRVQLRSATIDLRARVVLPCDGSPPVPLGSREVELLTYLLGHPERAIPREELLREVWGVRSRTTRALDMCVRRLRELLEADPAKPEHLHTVRGVGYRFDPPRRDPVAPRPVAFHLPARLDAFVGRTETLEALTSSDAPLTVLLGPPGVGKSRLALEYGRRALAEYPGGVWFCELAEADTEAGICAVVARSLGIQLQGEPAAQLAEVWADRGRALLVLDNLEHLMDRVTPLMERWLGRAPELRVLGTSRERPGLSGEREIEVGPLTRDQAAQLLADRAGPSARLTPLDPRVLSIIDRVDRVPLAIELAAARLRGLSVAELDARLAESLDALQAPTRRPERHSSVTRALAWSWALLTAPEQRALAQLSVFRGGIPLEGAEAVLACGDGAPSVEMLVERLVDRSLVTRMAEAGVPRFGLLEMVREFAAHRLTDTEAEVRHGRWAAGRGTPEAVFRLQTHGGLAPVRRERANLEHAMRRAVARRDAEVAVCCASALDAVLDLSNEALASVAAICEVGTRERARAAMLEGGRAPLDEAVSRYEGALAHWRAIGEAAAVARTLSALGRLHGLRREPDACERRHAEARQVARALDDAVLAAWVEERSWDGGNLEHLELTVRRVRDVAAQHGARQLGGRTQLTLAIFHCHRGRLGEAAALAESAVRVFDAVGDQVSATRALHCLGAVRHLQGEVPTAREALRTVLQSARVAGDRDTVLFASNHLGALELAAGRLEAAGACFDDALVVARARGLRSTVVFTLGQRAQVDVLEGRAARAHERLASAEPYLDDPEQMVLWRAAVAVVEGAPEARELLGGAEPDSDLERAEVLAELGILDLADGHLADARERLEAAVRCMDTIEHVLPEHVLASSALGLVRVLQGEPSAGVPLLDRGEAVLRRLEARPSLARALLFRVRAARTLGDSAAAEAALDEAAQLAPPGLRHHVERMRDRAQLSRAG